MLYLEIGSYYLGMIVVFYVKFSKEHDETIKFKIKMAAFAEKCKFSFQIRSQFIWQHFWSKVIFFLDSLVYFLQKPSISVFRTSYIYEL